MRLIMIQYIELKFGEFKIVAIVEYFRLTNADTDYFKRECLIKADMW